jgi:hypothetical protein
MHASYRHAQPSAPSRVKPKWYSAHFIVTICRDVLQMSSMIAYRRTDQSSDTAMARASRVFAERAVRSMLSGRRTRTKSA